MTELLVGLVVLPILAASSAPVVGRYVARTGWPIALAALLLQLGMALVVATRVASDGAISHAVGAFQPPLGIELVADGLSVPFVLLIAGVSLALLAYTRNAGPRSNPFYSLYLLLVAGLTGVCLAGDVFNLYVFLEISGLAAYALVARGSGGPAALAALRYLLLGTIGATFYLLGVGYLYVGTGTLNMADLARTLDPGARLSVVAFVFVGFGLAVKMALYPLHTWQPDAYQRAPTAVAALLSALVSTVAGYALIRVSFGVFTVAFFRANPLVDDAILLLAGGSIVAGGVLALRQETLTRVFAYSSVAQFGLAAVGIALGSVPALVGSVIQLIGHGVMKGGLFAAAGVVERRTGAQTMAGYAGLARGSPWAAGSLAVIGLGMIGIPPTVGFVAKWFLAVGAVEAGAWFALAIVLGSTFPSLWYFGRMAQQLYVAEGDPMEPLATVPRGMTGVAVAAAVGTVLLGFAGLGLAELLEPTVVGLLEP